MTELFSNPNFDEKFSQKKIKNRSQILLVKPKKLQGRIRKFKVTIYNLIGNKNTTSLKNVKARTGTRIGMNGGFNTTRYLF